MSKALNLIFGCAVSVLTIYLLLQQVPLEQLGPVLGNAAPLGIVVAGLSIAAGLLARAFRWRAFFQPERNVPMRPLIGTLAISYMASTFLPFRAGEVVRAVFLSRRERLALPRVVGTILLEKLFDFLAIAVLLLGLMLTTPLPDAARAAGVGVGVAIVGGFGFVVALAIWRAPTLSALGWVERRVPFGLGRHVGLVRAAAQFAEGTDALRVPRLWVPMLGWSVVAWAAAYLATWAGALAVGVDGGAAAIVFLLVLTSSGQAVPSSPGYVGVYHYLAVVALTAFGVERAPALAAAVLVHAVTYGTLVVGGLVALWLGGYGVADLLGAARGGRSPIAPSLSARPLVASVD